MIATENYGEGFVHYWDGFAWTSYNGYTTDSTTFYAGGIDIACYGNKPYVSVRTGSGTPGKTGVPYGNETNGVNGQWECLNGTYAGTAAQDCYLANEWSDASLAINSSGDVYTAYKAYYDSEYHAVLLYFRCRSR